MPIKLITILTLIPLVSLGCAEKEILNRPEVSQTNTHSPTVDTDEVAGLGTSVINSKKIKVGDQELEVEVADSDELRTQGLSGRAELPEGKGMLFDFSSANYRTPGFWMKDMLISIDIIWINGDKVIGIEKSVPLPPENEDLKVYYPPSEITHALEVPAGWSDKNQITAGTTINLQL